MDLRKYLDRIHYDGRTYPDHGTLCAIHRAHLLAVPFENLDIHSGREIVLNEERLFHKIVEERRGGFCYELNGLFAVLLRELGFQVRLLAAGVADETGEFGPEYDHLTLLVDLQKPYLADVGFGECFLEPLAFNERSPDGYYLSSDTGLWMLFRDDQPQYRFDLKPHELADYTGMCRYHQTSPASHFTQNRMITQATPDGRIRLTNHKFVVVRNGAREEFGVDSPAEFDLLYQRHFRSPG